jgi:hypothetical protein
LSSNGFLLVIDGHHQDAVPRALLHRDLVTESTLERVTLGRGEAAELDVGALPSDGGHLSEEDEMNRAR